jgi:hypothetical protein
VGYFDSVQHNQTRPEWLTRPAGVQGEVKGTGVFVVPAPDKGILEVRKILVEGIGYRESLKRAEGCVAFKWVPSHVRSNEQLSADSCDGFCLSMSDCNGACACIGGICE